MNQTTDSHSLDNWPIKCSILRLNWSSKIITLANLTEEIEENVVIKIKLNNYQGAFDK